MTYPYELSRPTLPQSGGVFGGQISPRPDGRAGRGGDRQRGAKAYDAGKALNRSTNFMLDEVIDPAETRTWVVNMLAAIRPGPPRAGKKRPMIDAW